MFKANVFKIETLFSRQLKTFIDAEKHGAYQKSNSKLTLKNSTIDGAGYGVSTNSKTCFRSGDYITKFEGNKIEDFNLKNNINRKYWLQIRNNYIIEGISEPEVNKGLGSFINSYGNFSDTNENLENNKTIRNKYNTTFYYDNNPRFGINHSSFSSDQKEKIISNVRLQLLLYINSIP